MANYLKAVAEKEGIPAELVGDDPQRMNFTPCADSGRLRPLLLMAHSDVVRVDRSPWTIDPGRRTGNWRWISSCSPKPLRKPELHAGGSRHGSLPRDELARAILKLSDADEPVHLNSTTRADFREIAKLEGYAYIKST